MHCNIDMFCTGCVIYRTFYSGDFLRQILFYVPRFAYINSCFLDCYLKMIPGFPPYQASTISIPTPLRINYYLYLIYTGHIYCLVCKLVFAKGRISFCSIMHCITFCHIRLAHQQYCRNDWRMIYCTIPVFPVRVNAQECTVGYLLRWLGSWLPLTLPLGWIWRWKPMPTLQYRVPVRRPEATRWSSNQTAAVPIIWATSASHSATFILP